ncbi:hypothetical protein [Amycolatopsis halotolerans]|uniref:hypothetical protein n=1 Tax=Amycolatopsis halotolerans TaxID=330083 RepID=UPI003617D915
MASSPGGVDTGRPPFPAREALAETLEEPVAAAKPKRPASAPRSHRDNGGETAIRG